MVGSGLVVSRSRRDVNILAGTTFKKSHVARNLRGKESDKLAYSIEGVIAKKVEHLLLVVDIGNYLCNTSRHLVLASAAIKQPQVVTCSC